MCDLKFDWVLLDNSGKCGFCKWLCPQSLHHHLALQLPWCVMTNEQGPRRGNRRDWRFFSYSPRSLAFTFGLDKYSLFHLCSFIYLIVIAFHKSNRGTIQTRIVFLNIFNQTFNSVCKVISYTLFLDSTFLQLPPIHSPF